jgi:hypothetical protein
LASANTGRGAEYARSGRGGRAGTAGVAMALWWAMDTVLLFPPARCGTLFGSARPARS